MSKLKTAFVCVHNSCRSQMAEAISKVKAADVFTAYSAGTHPKPNINGDAADIIIERYGYDMSKTQKPKLLSEIPPVDIVITMGCNVECPVLPCRFREDWKISDPSGKGKEEFLYTAKIIEEKVHELKQKIIEMESI